MTGSIAICPAPYRLCEMTRSPAQTESDLDRKTPFLRNTGKSAEMPKRLCDCTALNVSFVGENWGKCSYLHFLAVEENKVSGYF